MKYKTAIPGKISPVEPPCRKTIYHTSQEAEDMIGYIRETRTGRVIRPYRCSKCGFWHLTSKVS